MFRGWPPLAVLAAALALGACGSDDGGSNSSTTAKRAAAGGPAPPQLLGTYTMTLARADLPPNPPPELSTGLGRWTLRIVNSGGIDNGRAIALIAPGNHTLEGPGFGVSADRITLRHEECNAGGDAAFYDNVYRWKISGRTLRFTTVSNRCPDHVAQTLLTVHPWTRTS
jgi:hypothetical protein